MTVPDFAKMKVEIDRLREDLEQKQRDYEWARTNDRVALSMAAENRSGARQSYNEAVQEAIGAFRVWLGVQY